MTLIVVLISSGVLFGRFRWTEASSDFTATGRLWWWPSFTEPRAPWPRCLSVTRRSVALISCAFSGGGSVWKRKTKRKDWNGGELTKTSRAACWHEKKIATVKEEIFVGEKFRTFPTKTFHIEFNFVLSNWPEKVKTRSGDWKACKPDGRKFGMEINFVHFSIIWKLRN